jgi:hypothetical protein
LIVWRFLLKLILAPSLLYKTKKEAVDGGGGEEKGHLLFMIQ